jgi:hypothetical protein
VDDESLDASRTYHYCVAWQVAVTENGVETTLPWDLVSAVRRVDLRRLPPGTQGVAPDWSSRGSVLDLMPDLAVQVRAMLAQVTAIGDRAGGGARGAVSDGLAVLERNIDAFSERLEAVSVRSAQLAAGFADALPGLYATSFSGTGGTTFLLAELARRLNDASDATRPPFDSNEYVMGVVMVAGGPRLADVQASAGLLQTLFDAPRADDPLHKVLDEIDGLIDHEEQRVFGPDLTNPILAPNGQPVDPADPPGSPQSPSSVVDPTTGLPKPGVAGVDPLTGLPPAPTPYGVIADDGTGVRVESAKNPDAGFTNEPNPEPDPDALLPTDRAPADGSHTYTPT